MRFVIIGLIVGTGGIGGAGCADPPPRVSTALDLTLPATEPAPRIPLVPVALKTQDDFDALTQRFLGQHDMGALLDALDILARAAKPGERAEDALLLMRLGQLYRDLDGEAREQDPNAGYLQKALALGTRLRAEAPQSPHTLFLQGYIPFAFLGGGANRPMLVSTETREFAAACREQWHDLLAVAPDYDGPDTMDHDYIQKMVTSLDAALALQASPAPTPVAPPVATATSRAEVEALNTFARFEIASEGDRKGICSDWSRAVVDPTVTRSNAELELDLACATGAGNAELAVPLIVRLRDLEGGAFAPCLALARLRERADKHKLESALRNVAFDCR